MEGDFIYGLGNRNQQGNRPPGFSRGRLKDIDYAVQSPGTNLSRAEHLGFERRAEKFRKWIQIDDSSPTGTGAPTFDEHIQEKRQREEARKSAAVVSTPLNQQKQEIVAPPSEAVETRTESASTTPQFPEDVVQHIKPEGKSPRVHQKEVVAEVSPPKIAAATRTENLQDEPDSQIAAESGSLMSNQLDAELPVKFINYIDPSLEHDMDDIDTKQASEHSNTGSRRIVLSRDKEPQELQSPTSGEQQNLEEMDDPTPWLKTLDKIQATKDLDLAQETATTIEVEPRPIHVIGLNKYGNFISQSLVNSGTPVTFLMSRPVAIQEWHDAGETVRLLRNGKISSTPGISIEPAVEDTDYRYHSDAIENPDIPIENLVVASHPGMMLASVRRVAHRLRPNSTVLFCENGLGIVDLVNKHIFPDPEQRPHYILANLDHDLREGRGRFDVAEARTGTFSCTKLPKHITKKSDEGSFTINRKYFDWPASAKYLIGALSQAPDLNTKTLGHKSFYKQQLMNVAVHTVIDSISVSFDIKCEDLLFNYRIYQYMQKVLGEVSQIICALPEIDTIPQAKKDFSVKQLQHQVKRVLFNIGDNYTDFLLDVREGKRRSGMDFYSGYLVGRAQELQIPCPILDALRLQVEGKQQYYSRKAKSHIPFDFAAVRRVHSGHRVSGPREDDGKV